jgi:hypothetical protein
MMNEKRFLEDKAYMERAIGIMAPGILRAMARQEERERQRAAAIKVKAVIQEMASRQEFIDKFQQMTAADITTGDQLMLRIYGCSSLQELGEELEKENEASLRIISRLSSWLAAGLRDKIEDWLIGDMSTEAVLAAMPGRA